MRRGVMNMLKQQKYMIQMTKLLALVSLISIFFSGCSHEKICTISNFDESEMISKLLNKNCYMSEGNEFKYTEKQLVALEYDVKCVLEILNCNLQNYIYDSKHKYYIVKIEDEIQIEELEDFKYVYKPEDFCAIQSGEYKGYVKEPYLNISIEIDNYARLLSLYKTIFVYLNKIDNKYLSDASRYEYLFEYYLSKI